MTPARTFSRVAALLGLLAALTVLAVSVPAPVDAKPTPELLDGDLEPNLREAILASGAMVVHPRAEVFDATPPETTGILALRPRGTPAGERPSRTFGAAEARAHPERVYVSVAVDPRDLVHPERGILNRAHERGPAWVRGACVTVFENGAAATSTTAGIRVHGGGSRARQRKSLRLEFDRQFGATAGPAAFLPGASGDHLVLHADWRRQRFVNPIGYEWLDRCGVATVKTRPVRVILNGVLQRGVYFATEHIDDSHLRQRYGGRRIQLLREKEKDRSNDYRKIRSALERRSPPPNSAQAGQWFDVDGAERWLAGILMLAPYDCLQGTAHRSERDPVWRWVAWDVDWGLGPWPDHVTNRTLTTSNVVELLLRGTFDLRATWFRLSMRQAGERRNRLLGRVRDVLDHTPYESWWRSTIERYRAHARRLLGEHAHTELRMLDQMESWALARPAALRAELREAFDLGPPRKITVRIAEGCSAIIDGHRYERDWTGYAFDGESLRIRAHSGASQNGSSLHGASLRGAGAASEAVSHTVHADATFEVTPTPPPATAPRRSAPR